MKSNRNYLVAKSKLKWSDICKDWGGYLTPSEILALIDNGCIPTDSYQKVWLSYVLNKKKEGTSNPMWFYFSKVV